jgi:hypothetical protein
MAPVRHSLLLRLRRLSVTNEVTVTHTESKRALHHPNGQTIGLHNGASSHKHTFIHTRTCTSLSLSHTYTHTHAHIHSLTQTCTRRVSGVYLSCPCRGHVPADASAPQQSNICYTHTGTDTHIVTDTDTHTQTHRQRGSHRMRSLCTGTHTRTDRDAPVGGCNGPFLWVSALAEGQVLFI